ncbi:DUF6193 family natural product biosynthesis protein [Actinoplanes sp. NPDC049265]|uniref:DUF6193 family natural product biosynthesis protein n=1 Tax=Actinoplanes sp. NPDC049265 TaxID=3363902 RepID=UPI00370FB351
MADHFLYPDVAAAGDLRVLLQRAFDGAGIPLRVGPEQTPGRVSVEAGDRSATVSTATSSRAFLIQLWTRTVQMAYGSIDTPDRAAAAIGMFLSGVPLRRLTSAWPFLTFTGFAEAFERGEPYAIAFRWQEYLDISSTRSLPLLNLHAFLLAASTEPRLRALFPFTSHADLGFRRQVSDPASRSLAWVRPHGEGRYLVTGPHRARLGRPGPIRTPDLGPVPGALGPAGPGESVTLVLRAMAEPG